MHHACVSAHITKCYVIAVQDTYIVLIRPVFSFLSFVTQISVTTSYILLCSDQNPDTLMLASLLHVPCMRGLVHFLVLYSTAFFTAMLAMQAYHGGIYQQCCLVCASTFYQGEALEILGTNHARLPKYQELGWHDLDCIKPIADQLTKIGVGGEEDNLANLCGLALHYVSTPSSTLTVAQEPQGLRGWQAPLYRNYSNSTYDPI